MELEKIKEVRHTANILEANRLLKEGWILLDAKVVEVGDAKGVKEAQTRYILGRR